MENNKANPTIDPNDPRLKMTPLDIEISAFSWLLWASNGILSLLLKNKAMPTQIRIGQLALPNENETKLRLWVGFRMGDRQGHIIINNDDLRGDENKMQAFVIKTTTEQMESA